MSFSRLATQAFKAAPSKAGVSSVPLSSAQTPGCFFSDGCDRTDSGALSTGPGFDHGLQPSIDRAEEDREMAGSSRKEARIGRTRGQVVASSSRLTSPLSMGVLVRAQNRPGSPLPLQKLFVLRHLRSLLCLRVLIALIAAFFGWNSGVDSLTCPRELTLPPPEE